MGERTGAASGVSRKGLSSRLCGIWRRYANPMQKIANKACRLRKPVLIARLTRWEPPVSSRQSGRSSGVEHNLAKVGVEGSNPFARSSFSIENRISGPLSAAADRRPRFAPPPKTKGRPFRDGPSIVLAFADGLAERDLRADGRARFCRTRHGTMRHSTTSFRLLTMTPR